MKKVLLISLAAMAASSAFADLYNGGSIVVPSSPVGTFSSSVNVLTGVTKINSVTLRFNPQIGHTWVGDLNVRLVNSNNVVLNLFSRVGTGTFGDSSALFGTYTFAMVGADFQAAAAAAAAGVSVADGTYAAFGKVGNVTTGAVSMTDLDDGGDTLAGGIWTLEIEDFATPDGGTLDSWTLDVEAVPEPATMVVLGAAALAAAARKRRK